MRCPITLTGASSSPETPKREDPSYSKNKTKGQSYLSVERRGKGPCTFESYDALYTTCILVRPITKWRTFLKYCIIALLTQTNSTVPTL